MSEILEAGMLICFGFAWPVNIYKSIKSGTTKGKSVLFLFMIWAGYLLGIANKALFNYDYVMWLYILNLLMVSVDIGLFFRNKSRENSKLSTEA